MPARRAASRSHTASPTTYETRGSAPSRSAHVSNRSGSGFAPRTSPRSTTSVPSRSKIRAFRSFPAQGGVDELVRAHRVLRVLRLAQRRVVDLRRNSVDEPPLQHGAPHRGDSVLGVRIEVEAEPLPVRTVV